MSISREASVSRHLSGPDMPQAMRGSSYHARPGGKTAYGVDEEFIFRAGIDIFTSFLEELPREEEKTAMLLRAILVKPSQVKAYLSILEVTPQRMGEMDAQLREKLGM